jgi:hypothetical protein
MSEYQAEAGIDGLPAPLQSPGGRTRSRWRGDWQIAVVIAVLVLAGGVTLWILRSSHHTHKIVLPVTLLSLSKYTGPNAATDEADMYQQAQADSSGNFVGVVGLYGNLPGGPALALVVQIPCGGSTCMVQTSNQIVQSLKRSGDPAVRAFSVGGGIMVCNTFRNSTQIHCGWIDQATSGSVFFAGGFTSGLANAAAKTTQIIAAIER